MIQNRWRSRFRLPGDSESRGRSGIALSGVGGLPRLLRAVDHFSGIENGFRLSSRVSIGGSGAF